MNARSAVPFALAALLAVPALAQDEGAKPPPKAEAPPSAPKSEVDTRVEIRGNRYRLKLKRGTQIEGLLPRGLIWEKMDQFGDYEEAKEADKGSGLRVFYVLNMDGDIFIKRSDILDEDGIKDLGAPTLEEVLALQQKVISQRKKVVEDREKAVREEIQRLGASAKEEERKAAGGGKGKPGEGKKGEGAGTGSDEVAKGDALLEKFPPPDWSKKRIEDIYQRETINKVYRTPEEAEFIAGFNLWKSALDRREKAEAEKKAKEESGKETEKKETPPAEGGK